MLNLEAPPRPYLDMLRDELRAYEAKRAAAAQKLADDAEYAAQVDRMWQHAIGVKRAQIEREEAKCLT